MKIRIQDVQRTAIAGGAEPVTLAQVKAHCRIDFTDDDTYLTSLITQCRRSVENFCHISIYPAIVQSYITYLPDVSPYIAPSGPYLSAPLNTLYIIKPLEFPYGPVLPTGTVIGSGPGTTVVDPVIVATDNNNVNQILSLANGDYYIRGIRYQTIQIVNQVFGNATMTYYSGMTTVPDDLVLAILNEIAFRYDNRGDVTKRYATQNVGLSESSVYLAEHHKRYSWL